MSEENNGCDLFCYVCSWFVLIYLSVYVWSVMYSCVCHE